MGKKNSQTRIVLETNLKESLKKEAKERHISLSELIRQRVRNNSQLTRIEILLEKLLERGADFSLLKAEKSAVRR